jgi:hypothetical protein
MGARWKRSPPVTIACERRGILGHNRTQANAITGWAIRSGKVPHPLLLHNNGATGATRWPGRGFRGELRAGAVPADGTGRRQRRRARTRRVAG